MKKVSLLNLISIYILISLLVIMNHAALATDIYRIVDENGRVQYTQIPPYKDASKMQLKGVTKNNNNAPSVSQQPSLQERQEKYSNYLESERLERKQKREQLKQEKAELASNCFSVRADLEDMNQGGVIYYDLDENGERVYIDESRIQAKKERLTRYLNNNCQGIIK